MQVGTSKLQQSTGKSEETQASSAFQVSGGKLRRAVLNKSSLEKEEKLRSWPFLPGGRQGLVLVEEP